MAGSRCEGQLAVSSRRYSISIALVAFAVTVLAAANAIAQSGTAHDPMPTDELRAYITKPGKGSRVPGWLELSSTIARYQTLNGEMELEYVGQMPANGGSETGGAAVYRVKNADAFYRQNKEKGCRDGPILWLTVQQRPHSIRVGWLGLENWREDRPDGHGLCYAESRYMPNSPDLFDPY